jgi:hypothetical protein
MVSSSANGLAVGEDAFRGGFDATAESWRSRNAAEGGEIQRLIPEIFQDPAPFTATGVVLHLSPATEKGPDLIR